MNIQEIKARVDYTRPVIYYNQCTITSFSDSDTSTFTVGEADVFVRRIVFSFLDDNGKNWIPFDSGIAHDWINWQMYDSENYQYNMDPVSVWAASRIFDDSFFPGFIYTRKLEVTEKMTGASLPSGGTVGSYPLTIQSAHFGYKLSQGMV